MVDLNILLFCSILLVSMLITSTAVDTIAINQTLRDNDTIVSAGEKFELGFFSPDASSSNRYVGIWYKKISVRTVVWVANREIPLTDTSGALSLNGEGILSVLHGTNRVIWSSNSSGSARNPVAQLLDTGNLIVRNEDDSDLDNYLWQSFDYFGNTFLPSMKYGMDLVKGLNRYLVSWKSDNDPSLGYYTNQLDPHGYPQILLRRGSIVTYNSGPWNGERFSGMTNLKTNSLYTFEFVLNQKEIYYKYELVNSSVLTRMVLSTSGSLQRFTWIDRTQEWELYLTAQMDNCDRYAMCGVYGSCNINNSPPCGCLKGFEPLFPEEWNVADWSNGCMRKTPLDCESGDRFLKYSGVKFPDTQKSWFNESMNLKECEALCLRNCSCVAYANTDVRGGGSGCLLWFDDLIDIRVYSEDGQDLYVRMAASELDRSSGVKRRVIIIIIPVISAVTVLSGLCLLQKYKRKMNRRGITRVNNGRNSSKEDKKEVGDLPLLDFNKVANATNNFSDNYKLGEGGFGPVYKGILEGQDIAVKRLSKESKQGVDEFKNEVSCIAKLQHRNLVRLLGYCIEEGERMLIYEYMPNKSLDSFIFDKEHGKSLDWPKRYNIINGIARGLLYLHQDSRLRIIHRDLKTSNILLDIEMNPRISDFGMARSLEGSDTELNTKRVVGTYGYMSPEYAIDGIFSTKSDVFSFGVLVLEIVSGKKNRGFHHIDHNHNLIGHAWRLYKKGKEMELIDGVMGDSCKQSEVSRAIHIGLLCVQRYPEDRPSMSSVVLMLSSEIALPSPKRPGFFTERRRPREAEALSSNPESSSSNQITVTFLAPR